MSNISMNQPGGIPEERPRRPAPASEPQVVTDVSVTYPAAYGPNLSPQTQRGKQLGAPRSLPHKCPVWPRHAPEPNEFSAAAVMDAVADGPVYWDAHPDILTETCNVCDTPRSACKPDCILQERCERHALRACRRCAHRVLPARVVQACMADPWSHGLQLSIFTDINRFAMNYSTAVKFYGGWYTWRHWQGIRASGESYTGPGWPGPLAGERVEADLGRPGAGPTYRPACRSCGNETGGGSPNPGPYATFTREFLTEGEFLQFQRRQKDASTASPPSVSLYMIEPIMRIQIANREEVRKRILTETCYLCKTPQTACRPERAKLPVCRYCAVVVLPVLIAQAVLADPHSLFAAEEAKKAWSMVGQICAKAQGFYWDHYNLNDRAGLGSCVAGCGAAAVFECLTVSLT
jgi:hypothetical protein